MSLTGGLGNAATVCYKRLALLLSSKWDQPYSSTITWIRFVEICPRNLTSFTRQFLTRRRGQAGDKTSLTSGDTCKDCSRCRAMACVYCPCSILEYFIPSSLCSVILHCPCSIPNKLHHKWYIRTWSQMKMVQQELPEYWTT